jgi:hypothetical protein
MSWAKHLALIGQGRNAYIVIVKKLEEKTNWSTLDGRILKWAKMKLIGSYGSSKHGNEN